MKVWLLFQGYGEYDDWTVKVKEVFASQEVAEIRLKELEANPEDVQYYGVSNYWVEEHEVIPSEESSEVDGSYPTHLNDED